MPTGFLLICDWSFVFLFFFFKESLDMERTDEEIADNQGSVVG